MLTLYGISVLTMMMLAYALENRHRAFVLAFSVCCLLSSLYGFLTGVWPFGVIELIWSAVAFGRWRGTGSPGGLNGVKGT